MVSSIAIKHKQFNLTSVICLHTVKLLNSSIWPIDEILMGTTTPELIWPGSNDIDGVLYILLDQSLTIWWFSVISRALIGGGVVWCS